MRIAHKLTLLAFATCALIAAFASAAPAATVSLESTGTTCGTITETPLSGGTEVTGGCKLRGLSAGHIELAGPFGAMILCNMTIEGSVSGSGHGQGAATLDPCEQNSATPCTSMGTPDATERHAEVRIVSALGGGRWSLEAEFCKRLTIGFVTTEIECHITAANAHLTQISHTNQRVELRTPTGVHAPCEQNPNYGLLGTVNVVVDAQHPAVEVTG